MIMWPLAVTCGIQSMSGVPPKAEFSTGCKAHRSPTQNLDHRSSVHVLIQVQQHESGDVLVEDCVLNEGRSNVELPGQFIHGIACSGMGCDYAGLDAGTGEDRLAPRNKRRNGHGWLVVHILLGMKRRMQ